MQTLVRPAPLMRAPSSSSAVPVGDHMSITYGGLFRGFRMVGANIECFHEEKMYEGCPIVLAMHKEGQSRMLCVYESTIQLFEPLECCNRHSLTPRWEVACADRDASNAPLAAEFQDANTALIVSETIGLITCDFRDKVTSAKSVLVQESASRLGVSSGEVLSGCWCPDKRFMLVLSQRGFHMVDPRFPEQDLFYPFAYRVDPSDKFEKVVLSPQPLVDDVDHAGAHVLWVISRKGMIFVHKYLGNGKLAKEWWRSNAAEGIKITGLTTDPVRPAIAYITTHGGCVVTLNFSELTRREEEDPMVLLAQPTAITAVDVATNGTSLLLGGQDGVIRLWDIQKACSRILSSKPVVREQHKLHTAVALCSFLS